MQINNPKKTPIHAPINPVVKPLTTNICLISSLVPPKAERIEISCLRSKTRRRIPL